MKVLPKDCKRTNESCWGVGYIEGLLSSRSSVTAVRLFLSCCFCQWQVGWWYDIIKIDWPGHLLDYNTQFWAIGKSLALWHNLRYILQRLFGFELRWWYHREEPPKNSGRIQGSGISLLGSIGSGFCHEVQVGFNLDININMGHRKRVTR